MHRKPWRMTSVVATADHNTPTTGWDKGLAGIDGPDCTSFRLTTLIENLKKNPSGGVLPVPGSGRQGVIHVIGPGRGRDAPRHDDCLR